MAWCEIIRRDESPDSWSRAEVQEEANLEISRAEVVEELHRVARAQLPSRFQLDDHPGLDQKVRPKHSDNLSFVPNLGSCLAHDVQPSAHDLHRKRIRVDGL